ncbi:MAG: alpha/beta hydrolase [Xanthomonadales bacterium]|nr:alpha/beta hydrolase [Xanthomonadales bacterium]
MSAWRRSGAILATLGLLLGAGSVPAAETAEAPRLVDEACDFEIVDAAVAARLRCARLVVHRDPERPEEGRFEIAVVVKKSASPKPGATPILFLHGGPGGGVTMWQGRNPRDFVAGHDLVSFDMRGGGRSRPRVCEASTAALIANVLHPDGPAAGLRERRKVVEACRAEWQAAGFSDRHFGTARNVADAEALRSLLGVQRWRIYAESYGTTVAAHYLATHPEAIEAAVLDSLYPKDAQVHPGAEMQGRLMERVAADCRRDAACSARFPDVGRGQLDATVAALDAAPLKVGEGEHARVLDGAGLRMLIMTAASDEGGVRSLPLLIDAAARRDVALLAGPLSLIGAQGSAVGGANLAGTLATDCRDRARHRQIADLSDPMGLLLGVPNAVCKDWGELGETPRWPVATAVPVLVVSGGYDSFQPDPAPVLVEMGPSARGVEFPRAAHGARGSGACARDVIADFLTDPSAAPDTGCIADIVVPRSGFWHCCCCRRGRVRRPRCLRRWRSN